MPIELMGSGALFTFVLCDSSAQEAVCQGVWFTLRTCRDDKPFMRYEYDELISSDDSFNYWPNPTNGDFTFRRQMTELPTAELYLYDGYGRMTMSKKLKEGVSQTTMDVSDSPPGLYFIVYKGSDNSYFTGKLVIIR